VTEGPDTLTVYAPGSASNLGPGFDCLGVAFTGKGDRVRARRAGGPGVRVLAVSDPRIPTASERNTAALAAAAVLRDFPEAGLELEVEKGLPLSGGMGGSAASAVAGAVAADALFPRGRSRTALLRAALEAEAVVAGKHADNVAPSLLGGAVLVGGLEPPEIVAVRVHPVWTLVLVTPGYAVETARARAVLPAQVSRFAAVAQAEALACLVLGLERGDAALVRRAMVDRIAEPARSALYPGYREARAAALEAGAAGVAVSGAGPTVLALCGEGEAAAVGESMRAAYLGLGLGAAVHVGQPDTQGARVIS
jgi:homoserine kinase